MASYKAGLDPPSRPGESDRSRRMGTYMRDRPVRLGHLEADSSTPSPGHLDIRSGPSPSQWMQQSAISRPQKRAPSPNSAYSYENRAKGATGTLGFAQSSGSAKPRTMPKLPELKPKSSRNVLRRKPSTIAQRGGESRPTIQRSATSSPAGPPQASGERRPSIEAQLKSAEAYNEIFTRPRARTPAATETPRIIPEFDRYRVLEQATVSARTHGEIPHKLSTQDLPPPTPLLSGTPLHSGGSSAHRYSGYGSSGYSASPSTRFSESPGPGPYSRDTTPTSVASQSPGIIAPMKANYPKLRQASPSISRPPVTRRRAGSTPKEAEDTPVDAQGLPSLRESTTSSSSNYSSRTEKEKDKEKEKKKRHKKRLTPPPPSPPPRKSSQKFKKPTSASKESPSKASQATTKSVMTSSSTLSPAKQSLSPQSGAKATPPLRPSREGAPDLQSQLGDSIAVIQSNLAGISKSPDRRQSVIPRSATTPPLETHPALRPPQGSRLPSRNPSPNPAQPTQRNATIAPTGLGIIPDLRPQQVPVSRSGATRTPSPSVGNSKARFGLFGRRTKTTPDVPTLDTRERAPRKGPAAGTGHEGYGRYAARGRSSSVGTFGSTRDRSLNRAPSPQGSVSSDPFLRERMSPVIIAGGGEIIENRNASSELSRTESNTSLQIARPSFESKASSKSSLSHEVSRTTVWPSASFKDRRRPSDSSDDAIHGSLAFRRSVQRMNNSTSALPLPKALNIPNRGISPSMSSLDQSIMSDESQLDLKIEVDRGRKLQPKKSKKLEKRPRSPQKWNFFSRSKPASSQKEKAAVSVTVGKAPAKTVPHYAMIDSSDEQQEPDVLELMDILSEEDINVVGLSNEELDALQFGNYKANLERIGNLHSMMDTPLPEPSMSTRSEPASAAPFFSSPEPMPSTPELQQTELHLGPGVAPNRPSRLPQVGRIPKVVSARPQATSPKSFSRPFARLSTIQPLAPLNIDKESIAKGHSPSKSSSPEPQMETAQEMSITPVRLTHEVSDKPKSDTINAVTHEDFIRFSSRQDSQTTTSTSTSQGYAGTVALIPKSDAELEDDEVWNEYDELMENDDGLQAPASATSSHGVPFQYESYESRRLRRSKMQAKQSPVLASAPTIKDHEPMPEEDLARRSHFTSSSVYSTDLNARLEAVLATVPSPTTPMSFTDFFSGYGERNNPGPNDPAAAPKQRRASHSSSRKSGSSGHRSRSLSVGLRPISEQDASSPISQVNLRVGSMTVSKWLTFGHVLFSPAREEISQLDAPSSKRHSVLVIDGLGNDDWSFYAAETYSSATFYNLSPSRPLFASQRDSTSPDFPLTPSNHRQIQYTSPLHKFPFPSAYFDVVVFRFPSGMSESAYRNIIAESKRVLKPGGYLEMAILDLDMMNMGNRARRAVRGLKVKIQVADPDISLAPASDTVLRIVGKRGFSDVKTCNVGVPVASVIRSSSSNSSQEERSLADMIKDESHAGDEGITKMVAKVGRWWYTRCYEMVVLPDGDVSRSIFNDRALLGECEKWNSSFKLVVAYAQKPAFGRRKGASF